MSAALKDPWVQLLGFLVVVSGALTTHGMVQGAFRRPAAAPAAPPRGPASAPDSGSPAADRMPVRGTLAPPPDSSPSARPAQPSLEDVLLGRAPPPSPAGAQAPQGPAPSVSLRGPGVQARLPGPKAPGRWVVDASGAADSDSKSLGDVLASVKAGDTVLVRPGTYEGGLIDKDIRLLGAGKSRKAVVVSGSGAQTLSVKGARVLIKNLTLGISGPPYSKALKAAESEVVLEEVDFSGSGTSAAVEVERGSLKASDVAIACAYAGVVGGQSSRLELSRVRVEGCRGFGVGLARGARLEMTDGLVRGSGSFGVLVREADAKLVKSSVVEGSDCGLAVESGSVELKDSRVAKNACGVKFIAGGKLDAVNSVFLDNAQGNIAYNPVFASLIKIKSVGTRPALSLPEAVGGAGARGAGAPAAPAAARPGRGTRKFGDWDIFGGRRWEDRR